MTVCQIIYTCVYLIPMHTHAHPLRSQALLFGPEPGAGAPVELCLLLALPGK